MIFCFVTPDNREKYRPLMVEYFEKMTISWGEHTLDNYDTQNARYVVCEHTKYGVIGGLRLLSTMGPKLADEVLSDSGYSLHDSETWEASKIFFYIPSGDDIYSNPEEFEQICELFYTGLWEFLQNVCDIEVIVTLFPEEEHIDAIHFGEWPFVLESHVLNPFDQKSEDYVLGVLRIGEEEDLSLAS